MEERSRPLITALYLTIVVAVTLTPVPAGGSLFHHIDKWAHAGMFAGLAFLLYWSSRGGGRFLLAFLLSLTAAGLIELLQGPIPYRRGEWWDFAAGALGAAIGTLVAHVSLGGRGAASGGGDTADG